jgi:hypothetical protein
MDLVLRTGDQAIFDPVFGVATVVAPPGIITGSSRAKNDGAVVCVQGDEATVVVTTATYSNPSYTGGSGILTIVSLGPDQMATRNKSGRRPVLLRGSVFRARLQVVKPATNANGDPDKTLVYQGTGRFVSANTRVRAT